MCTQQKKKGSNQFRFTIDLTVTFLIQYVVTSCIRNVTVKSTANQNLIPRVFFCCGAPVHAQFSDDERTLGVYRTVVDTRGQTPTHHGQVGVIDTLHAGIKNNTQASTQVICTTPLWRSL